MIRTSPAQARILLREFATFYRYTFEGSLDYITLEEEYYQTLRYVGFMIARFGNDRIIFKGSIESGLERVKVPSFIIQPIVENAITHAMRPDDPLHLDLQIWSDEGQIYIDVIDDGVGMDEEKLAGLMDHDQTRQNAALKNVKNRIEGFYDSDGGLEIHSESGKGTHVRLMLGGIDNLRTEVKP
jgi:two-component system sensor histidine kinase LytS